MFRDIEMNDTATIVTKYDEDEQNSESCSGQSEEVDRHQVLHMIIEKAPPRLRRWLAMANHVLGNGRLGHVDAQLQQFTMNTWCTPQMIVQTHAPDQITHVSWYLWAAATRS